MLARLAATLASLDTAQPQAERLCQAIPRLTGADGAALTLEYSSDHRTTLCATDGVAEGLENLQEVLGQGPGFRAVSTREIVVFQFGEDPDTQWPLLAQAIDEQFGRLTLYAIPIVVAGQLPGIVTLYLRQGGQLSASLEQSQFLVNAIGMALLDEVQLSDDDDGLSGAWNNRVVVHQATGMIMAQLSCPSDDALALLRGHAYAHETDIYDIAKRVVDQHINFSHFRVEGD